MTIRIATDDTGTAYVDGRLLFTIAKCREAVSATVKDDIKVIAVQVINYAIDIGLMAMTSSGVVSDTNWKCTSTQPALGWNSPDFDDSKWPQAISYFRNDGSSYSEPNIRMYDFPINAHWLTTVEKTGSEMYCRRYLK